MVQMGVVGTILIADRDQEAGLETGPLDGCVIGCEG